MPNTRELRRRIRSVKNTAQITKAMEMVAATKMRRAQSQALSGRPYFSTMNISLSNLAFNTQLEGHPLMQENGNPKKAVLLLTTDKPLCGALNTNTIRFAQNYSSEHKQSAFYTIGKKGRNFIVKSGKDLVADFENPERATFRQARQAAKIIIDSFINKEIGEAYVIYPKFVSTLRQEPQLTKLLPIDPQEIKKLIDEEKNAKNEKRELSEEFLFEPNPIELLDFILVHSVEIKIYQSLLETKASEHSARMIAMQNATNNAKELVSDLELMYNQTRQDAITRELLEITSASAALE